MRGRGVLGMLVVVWLVIGGVAAWQRGSLEPGRPSCAAAGTIAATVVAGPLNYTGFHPRVGGCALPRPS